MIHLWKIAYQVGVFNRAEEKKVKERFYKIENFALIDKALKQAYRWVNPYRISKRFWGEHVYGETPLTSLKIIGEKLSLGPNDCFVDFGAGRGRGVFFIHQYFKCKAIAIEKIPLFVSKAQAIKEKFYLDEVEIVDNDFFSSSLNLGNVIYLAWTCFSDEDRQRLEKDLCSLKNGTRVVTVSYPMENDCFSFIDSFIVSFPWGMGEVFVQEKV
jgi:hypothetical protein